MKVFTVATRSGALAIAQTRIVTDALKKIYPDIQIEVRKITTRGDRDRHTALWNLRTSGFFTSKVEDALLTEEADFAVHSFKDLPTHQREGLTIAAVCDRQFPEDCLVTKDTITSIGRLPESAKIGTSSLRRVAQIKRLRADLQPVSIRGNVTTRLKHLDAGSFDAIILARAGIERLGSGNKISFCFDPTEFIPAPAQGALAIQTRTDDVETNELVSVIDEERLRITTFAERQVLVTMQCGCHAPVGAFAKIVGGDIEIHAFISNVDGRVFIRRQITGPAEKACTLAEKIANDMLAFGGKEILASLKE
jgi:hydroxymethylbilane synthase